jgi:hypothetical protein
MYPEIFNYSRRPIIYCIQIRNKYPNFCSAPRKELQGKKMIGQTNKTGGIQKYVAFVLFTDR